MQPLIDNKNIILFDLDGTILDNYDWTYSSLKATLSAFGYPTPDTGNLRFDPGDGGTVRLAKTWVSPGQNGRGGQLPPENYAEKWLQK